ncbi:hypothetical protein E2C01_100241 [Portunus trituberculatus]|uniref:Uncharacterized protein n=1 Tax=Portunus trituberculatus TaxID=210409 RepID=A0A5B7KD19_PORTR|nr:hypothetical protein [Portunus trituberculatus]
METVPCVAAVPVPVAMCRCPHDRYHRVPRPAQPSTRPARHATPLETVTRPAAACLVTARAAWWGANQCPSEASGQDSNLDDATKQQPVALGTVVPPASHSLSLPQPPYRALHTTATNNTNNNT